MISSQLLGIVLQSSSTLGFCKTFSLLTVGNQLGSSNSIFSIKIRHILPTRGEKNNALFVHSLFPLVLQET